MHTNQWCLLQNTEDKERDLERFEQSAAVPVRKSFLDQLAALKFSEKVEIKY